MHPMSNGLETLLNGNQSDVYADAGDQGAHQYTQAMLNWHIALCPDKRHALDKGTLLGHLMRTMQAVKAQIRVRGEHALQIIKCSLSLSRRAALALPTTRPVCTCYLCWGTCGWYASACLRGCDYARGAAKKRSMHPKRAKTPEKRQVAWKRHLDINKTQ